MWRCLSINISQKEIRIVIIINKITFLNKNLKLNDVLKKGSFWLKRVNHPISLCNKSIIKCVYLVFIHTMAAIFAIIDRLSIILFNLYFHHCWYLLFKQFLMKSWDLKSDVSHNTCHWSEALSLRWNVDCWLYCTATNTDMKCRSTLPIVWFVWH